MRRDFLSPAEAGGSTRGKSSLEPARARRPAQSRLVVYKTTRRSSRLGILYYTSPAVRIAIVGKMASDSGSGSSLGIQPASSHPGSHRKRRRSDSLEDAGPQACAAADGTGTDGWAQTFYTWTPSALSIQRCKKPGESIESPVFSHDGLDWRLWLYPRGCDPDCREYFSLFLELGAPSEEQLRRQQPVRAKFAFYTRNLKGEYLHRMGDEHRFGPVERLAGFAMYLRRRDMVDGFNGILCHVRAQKQPNALAPERTERRSLVTAAAHQPQHRDRPPRRSFLPDARQEPPAPPTDPRFKVGRDLDMFLDYEKFSDVSLVTPGKTFYAHKVVLAARSPVFHAMFARDADHEANRVVKILDVHDEVLKELLRFVYTGRVANVEDATCEMLIAAERFALDDLKAMCEKNLARRLSVENAANMLVLADRHKASELKAKAIRFINENAMDVIQSGGYRLIVQSYLHLIEELYRQQNTP